MRKHWKITKSPTIHCQVKGSSAFPNTCNYAQVYHRHAHNCILPSLIIVVVAACCCIRILLLCTTKYRLVARATFKPACIAYRNFSRTCSNLFSRNFHKLFSCLCFIFWEFPLIAFFGIYAVVGLVPWRQVVIVVGGKSYCTLQ